MRHEVVLELVEYKTGRDILLSLYLVHDSSTLVPDAGASDKKLLPDIRGAKFARDGGVTSIRCTGETLCWLRTFGR